MISTVLLLVLRDEQGKLSFFVNPEWRTIVDDQDLDYIKSLIEDLLERAKVDPDPLFTQITSLGVGPIVAQEVGSSLDNSQQIQKLRLGLVEL